MTRKTGRSRSLNGGRSRQPWWRSLNRGRSCQPGSFDRRAWGRRDFSGRGRGSLCVSRLPIFEKFSRLLFLFSHFLIPVGCFLIPILVCGFPQGFVAFGHFFISCFQLRVHFFELLFQPRTVFLRYRLAVPSQGLGFILRRSLDTHFGTNTKVAH